MLTISEKSAYTNIIHIIIRMMPTMLLPCTSSSSKHLFNMGFERCTVARAHGSIQNGYTSEYDMSIALCIDKCIKHNTY